MRRQRTASESGEANTSDEHERNSGNENELSEAPQHQRIRESGDSENEDMERNIVHDNDMHENGSETDSEEHGSSDNNSDSHSDNSDDDSDDDDEDEDMEHDDSYDSYDDEYDEDEGDDSDVAQHLDIMNQLQSALFGMSSAPMSITELDRLRTQLATGGLFSSGPATHSNSIRSIIRSLPQQGPVDPMILYSTFTELWEMIVLTGEEVESYEFDTVVDLKPLLPHLLRVLKWEDDCQIYGSEFLLYAVRCTRACVQYSPGCSRRLVEGGLVPLITRQLFSVEYIDLAEDLIHIIQLLTRSGVHAKACLHADGIRAVLGFVDFFALSVQVNAFTAAAQMAPALTSETLHLYLPPETATLLRATVRRYTETDAQVLKLVHQAIQTLFNAIQAASEKVDELCPVDFVSETLLSLAAVLPLDSALIISKLVTLSKLTPAALVNTPATLDFFKTLLKTASTNENLLETTLKLAIDLFCQSSQKPLQELIGLCLRNKNLTKIDGLPKNENLLKQVSEILLEFYLNSPSITLASRHSTLFALLLLDDCQTAPVINLVKMGALSRLLTTTQSDPLILVIGLEWCRVLSKQHEEFVSTALRQGLLAELDSINGTNLVADESLLKWLQMRLDSLNKTVFSGEEAEIFQIYIKHLSCELRQLITGANSMQPDAVMKINSVQELIELMKKENFTEYEWLGDPETCLARQLYDLLTKVTDIDKLNPAEFEEVCASVYKALNRYDTLFTLTLPLAKLTRATTSNPLEALAILARPLRVHFKRDSAVQVLVCDSFSSIGWLVKMGSSSQEDMRRILRDTTTVHTNGDMHQPVDRVYDALDRTLDSYGIVDLSSNSFNSQNINVYLVHADRRIALKPADSLVEIVFEHVVSGNGAEKWKRVNEIWSSGCINIVVENAADIVDTADSVDSSAVKKFDDDRIKLALDLLKILPFKASNDHLSSKLAKELDSPLLIGVNGISPHWLQSAQAYPFLYPLQLRVNLMKSVCLGRLRALWILQQRTSSGNLIDLNSLITVPRRKFKIHRDRFLECFKNVFRRENCGDLRLFDFEYVDELGTGHGPTMEFYALASNAVIENSYMTKEGLFPAWQTELDQDWYRGIGALVARAWFDDRIIDIPMHKLFLESMLSAEGVKLESELEFDDLKMIDAELYKSLKSDEELINSGVSFLVPGTEICLLTEDRVISSIEDTEQFKGLLMDRINSILIKSRDSFLQGFNSSFPVKFQECVRFFTPAELSLLFTQSLASSTDWTVPLILSALIPDHGYTPASPQIRWLAELIAEKGSTGVYQDKMELVRFLTGAVYLPVGGWKALRPPLTIVCKSDDTSVSSSVSNVSVSNVSVSDSTTTTSSSVSATTTQPTADLITPSPTLSSSSDTHDSYLPSVMTCANYLKLPRYSSKAVMKERLEYAIREGSGSFHLS